MKQFVVPQFIDVEDKIIGPITTRQFIIMLITGVFMFVAYRFFDFTLFIIVALFLFALGGTLAFAKINGQPFHFFLLNLLQTSRRPWLKIWYKDLSSSSLKERIKQEKIEMPEVKATKPPISSSRLAELSLVVNTGGVYGSEREFESNK